MWQRSADLFSAFSRGELEAVAVREFAVPVGTECFIVQRVHCVRDLLQVPALGVEFTHFLDFLFRFLLRERRTAAPA